MIHEFSPSRFRELVSEGVGALLIIIPSDLESLTDDMREVKTFELVANYLTAKSYINTFYIEYLGCREISVKPRNFYPSLLYTTFRKT